MYVHVVFTLHRGAARSAMKTLVLSSLALFPLLVGACDPAASTQDATDSERTPLGKADQAGSCQDDDGDYCGGQSAGRCWCDEQCEEFGDCCSDRLAVCEGEEPAFCADGHVETTDTFTDADNGMECAVAQQHCVTDDASECPQLSPLPPDFCADGLVVKGAASYISSADGMECSMPSVHCVTKDSSACPQFSPLPPDFCADGHIVKGADSFIASSDGKECRLPSVHCVTDDASACTDGPDFCANGTVASETVFVDGPEGFECTEAEVHCLTNDFGECPQLSPLPPNFCEHGEIVVGAPSYLSAADGMECQMPSVHCVTRDSQACPQFSPLPPNFCEHGLVMQGPASFIAATDGMECQIPSIHCVTADTAACAE